ncbi:carbohydrate-binding domain-containing protein [Paenibacillus xylaniclasticus]|uniref:carbohydrate-binding domain-containing protein n=1 Tax=Paenibacillus xylaniclasticus TaxID=588083 RepID=UPI000FDCAEBF|nr:MULTISPECIES: carbohydrate-binding domain-containing protein [Paenibacillus]GFN29774.1 cellulase family glycosylhydrolase [Paenibacillus curdlanolyticus]
MRLSKARRLWIVCMIAALVAAYLPVVGSAAAADEGPFVDVPASIDPLLKAPGKKPSEAGALRIIEHDGKKTLGDKDGYPIQLRGMSTHGLQWFPEILNNNAFATLANDWSSNVVRLAMYVGEGGYASNPSVIKQRVISGIEYAIANDLYVIVDWHVHAPGNPNASVYSGALDFFKEISELYPNHPNIIYELANEPSSNDGGVAGEGVTNDAAGWQAVKSYAEPIIRMLRDSGNENLVIVGSPNWSQRPDLAADDPIDDDNTAYTVHFYTGTHMPAADSSNRGNVMSNARYALEHGVAVFSTEWGTSEASGNNGPFLDKADEWLTFLNENNISWVNWSLTNKNETSGAFIPLELGKQNATDLDPGADQLWEPRELSLSGEYVRARIKGIPYEPIDRTVRESFHTIIWNFDDGTEQGFGVNGDSPVKMITLSNVNNGLQITGLGSGNDLSATSFWGNPRISADGTAIRPNVLGAEKLTMDVIAPSQTTVAIAAVPQSSSAGWANPNRAVQVTPEQFELQEDGSYRATLTITADDAPNLKTIASHETDNVLTNIILFIGTASGTDQIILDNIAVSGNRAVVEQPIVHAPLGTATLPSTFDGEEATRQGWNWDSSSGVKTALTIEQAGGSGALSWDTAYPDVKPTDGWASAPRLILNGINTTRGTNDRLTFDFYFAPVRASEGAISIHLAFAPPSLGYWAQAAQSVNVPLDKLDTLQQTAEGLYYVPVSFDLTNIADNKIIGPDTLLRDITLVMADAGSNFQGRMYIDNIRFNSVPDAPTGLNATAGNGQVTLSWNAVSAEDELTYNVKRSTTSGASYTTVASAVYGTTSYTDTGLTNGTTYYYVVTASNKAGESAYSSEVSAAPYSSNGNDGNDGDDGNGGDNGNGGNDGNDGNNGNDGNDGNGGDNGNGGNDGIGGNNGNEGNDGNGGNNGNNGNNGNGGSSGNDGNSNNGVYVPVVTPPTNQGNQWFDLPDADSDGIVKAAINGEVRIRANDKALANLKAIEFTSGMASVRIPAAVIKQLQHLLSEQELAKVAIVLRIDTLTPAEQASLLEQASKVNAAELTAAGDIVRLSLTIVDENGKEQRLSVFEQPVLLSFHAHAADEQAITDIFYIGDDGSLHYVRGGKREKDIVTAETNHFSAYGLLNYYKPFKDLNDQHWASEAIQKLSAQGIIQGVSADRFAPAAQVTRAQFAALLARALGLQAQEAVRYSDVDPAAYYADAVAAVSEAGIVNGRSETLFSPNAAITREEMTVMLMRAYTFVTGNTIEDSQSSYDDQDQISVWAVEAVNAAHSLGIIQGRSDNRFVPQGTATRAESALLIFRLLEALD